MRSSGNGDHGWRPFMGVLAIGVIAFGLSLQGAPAGEDDRPQIDRTAVTRVNADTDDGAASPLAVGTEAGNELAPFESAMAPPTTEVRILPHGDPGTVLRGEKAVVESFFEALDIVPDLYIMGPGNQGRCTLGDCTDQIALGGACTCDIQCDDQLPCNGRERCTGGVCVKGDPQIPNDTTGCLEVVDLPGGVIPAARGNRNRCTSNGVSCTTDADCTSGGISSFTQCDTTIGECRLPCDRFTNDECTDARACLPVTCVSDYCINTFGTGGDFCFDRIPHCTAKATLSNNGPAEPGTCTVAGECPSGSCINLAAAGYVGSGGMCECASDAHCRNGDCNEKTGLCRTTGYECDFAAQLAGGPCELVIGSCCKVGGLGNPWCDPGLDIETCNSDGGTWITDIDPGALNTETGETGCLNHCPRYSSGVRYPTNSNTNGSSDPENPNGSATIDFGPVVAVPCNNNGFLRIGDDYELAGGSYIALERFSFVGANDSGGTLVFEFREFDPPYTIAAELRVGVGTARGLRTFGSRENPLSQGNRQAIIPAKGWVVMRSPTFDADGDQDQNGHWFSHGANSADVGTNDPTQMWVTDGPVTNQTGTNTDVLRFEIRGVPMLQPFDACCTDSGGSGSCSLTTEPWNCKVCSGSGDSCFEDEHCWFCTGNVGVCDDGSGCSISGQNCTDASTCRARLCYEDEQCDLFDTGSTCNMTETCGTNSYLGQQRGCQVDDDCDSSPGMGDGVCKIMANAFADSGDLVPPSGYCHVGCSPDPCQTGACCAANGDCTTENAPGSCGGTWQGFGSTCDPNCCPSTVDTSGEFCWQADVHVLVVPPSITSVPTVVTITTTTDKATLPGDITVLGSGPISGQCEFLSCLNLNAAPATWSRTRCLSNADCGGGETCQHQPCSWDDELGGDFACKPGFCQSDGTTRCRFPGDCPLGAQGDNCQQVEQCERLDCGQPSSPGLGWVVTGQDDVRWEAFELQECGVVTLDYCCTDDNPNAGNGISTFGVGPLFKGCEGSPNRPMHCNGLSQPDNPSGAPCTSNADCVAGTCTTGGACNSHDDCALGTCSLTSSIKCRQLGDCPAGETCGGAGLCGGGTECEPLRDRCGASVLEVFPPPDSQQSQFGWWCGDGNPAQRWELPAGTYYLPINAQQICSNTGSGPCSTDSDCLNAGTCQIHHHEYQVHITTEKCQESSCCRLGPLCEFEDAQNMAKRCDSPPAGTCSGSAAACEVDGDCPTGICADSLKNCAGGTLCPEGESCVADQCRSNGTVNCSTDADCPAGVLSQCVGAERCVFDPCGQFICSNSTTGGIITCTTDANCAAGTCSSVGGACHDDFDCPPGTCGLPFAGKPCRVKDDCPSPTSNCINARVCNGGAVCAPQQCVDVPLCDVIDRPTCEADVDDGGLDGFFAEGAAVCDPPGTPAFQNVCFKGACCTDDTEGAPCKDSTVEPGDCVGSGTCGDFGPDGCGSFPGASTFVPGATCAVDPCPVCEFQDEDHCQILDLQITFIARCDSFVSQDFRCADDFRAAESGVLDRICWWPAFAPPAGSPECSDPGAAPADDYKVRIYPDLGNVPNEGAEITAPGGQDLLIDVTAPVLGRIWQYSAAIDGPDVVLAAGECYWIEVNGIGNASCNIFWGQANKGNDYSMQDFNLPDYPHYTTEDAANTDLAWCLSLAIFQSPPLDAGCDSTVLGGCCLCPQVGTTDPATCIINTIDECGSLSDPNGGVGKWKIFNKCSGSNFACTIAVDGTDNCPAGQGTCVADATQCDPNPCQGFPANDACVDAIPITHPGNDPAAVITTLYNVFCSDSEGPATNCAIGGGDLSFGLWYEYTAPVCGLLRVESCNSLPIFDGMGAIYRKSDFTPGNECAGIAATPNSDAACNDDGCGAGGPWSYVLNALEGEEFLIRVGSWWDGDPANIPRARDSGFFELFLTEGASVDPNNPHCGAAVAPPLAAPYPHNFRKNRYISFDPNKVENGGVPNLAFKIEITGIEMGSCNGGDSAPCRYAQGTGLNEPANNDCRRCSTAMNPCISAAVDCVPNTQGCNLSGETCSNNDPATGATNLGLIRWVGPENGGRFLAVTQAFREVRPGSAWPDVIHVGDCEIVPQATYAVRAVDANTEDESDPLSVQTTVRPAAGVFAWWADNVGTLKTFCNGNFTQGECAEPGDCGGSPCVLAWAPPNGFTNVDDIQAALGVFNAFGPNQVTPVPAGTMAFPARADITWVDMHGDTGGPAATAPPQGVANAADVTAIVTAFGGRPYPFNDPADCPDAAVWP